MTDQQFEDDFRMSRGHFFLLHQKLITTNAFQTTPQGKPTINSEKCLCIALWYFATQDSFRSISSRFAVSKSTVVTCVRKVIDGLLNEVCQHAIKLPRTIAEREAIAQEFEDIAGFENILGALDGCHIEIRAPAREDKQTFFNRKKDYSMVLQGLCDANCFFLNVDVRWPGSVHDARVFKTSDLYPLCAEVCAGGEYHLIGDSAYPLKSYLLRPYRRSHRLNLQQKLFNRVHSKSRQVIERAFGFLKTKFRRLFCLDRLNVEDIGPTIIACCILHNICLASEDYARELIFGSDNDNDEDNEDNDAFQENEQNQINPVMKRQVYVNRIWEMYH